MRSLWIAVFSLILSMSVAAADERPCDLGIGFAPSGGSLGGSSAVTWRAEPANTASRVVMVIGADGKSKAQQAKPGRHKVKLKRGVSTIVLVFYDAKGRVICTATTSARGTGTGGGGGAGFDTSAGSSSNAGDAIAESPTVVVMGRYVVVFWGDTGYTGPTSAVNKWVATGETTFDGRTVNLSGYIGLEIWGNNQPNTIYGSALDDVIHGGDESCTGDVCNPASHLGDTIYGGDGNDWIFGGNESCKGDGCNGYTGGSPHLGDVIFGEGGDDYIEGGDESCEGPNAPCNVFSSRVGDVISGGSGKDTILGGNETCVTPADSCSQQGTTGDKISGDADDDLIFGGDETCVGQFCAYAPLGGIVGDEIDGGEGDDEIHGGDEICGPNCFGAGGDFIDGGNGMDTVYGDSGNNVIAGAGPGAPDPVVN